MCWNFFESRRARAQRELQTQNTALSRAWLSAASGATLELLSYSRRDACRLPGSRVGGASICFDDLGALGWSSPAIDPVHSYGSSEGKTDVCASAFPARAEMSITVRRSGVLWRRRGRASKTIVVPANAGTHNPGVAVDKIWWSNFLRFRSAGGYGSRLALASARLAGTTAVCLAKTAAGSAPLSAAPRIPRHRQTAAETPVPFCLPAPLPCQAR